MRNIGILGAMAQEIDEVKALLTDKTTVKIANREFVVAQMLASAGNSLFYYTWPKDERHYYEIDFLLSRQAKLCPVEVKSSGYNTHASLDAFCKKYSSRIGDRFLIYTKDLRKDGAVTLLPAFMTYLL